MGFVLVFHKEENASLFEQIILSLKKRYTIVSIEELENILLQKKSLRNICHISFDDGHASFYNIVFPVLRKYQVPVSLFISPEIVRENKNYWFQEIENYDPFLLRRIIANKVSIPVDRISKYPCNKLFECLTVAEMDAVIKTYQQQKKITAATPQNINIDQLKEMQASGLISIGAHTQHHPILTNEDATSVANQITSSISELEKIIEKPVKYFAYPNGRPTLDFAEREVNILQQNNICLAFSTATDHLSTSTNLLSIPRMGFARMGLSPDNPLVHFRLWLGKKWIRLRSIYLPTEKQLRPQMKKALGK
jgi:peptidoglycan/xylan/chitin deacetylase (PgdA/CDA1 family)